MEQLFVCGGGANNAFLMSLIETYARIQVQKSPECDWIEAMAFAWLAFMHLEDREASLPEVTGATRKTVLGGLYKAK